MRSIMARSIEEIVGKIERERVIPGTRPGQIQSDNVRYVSFGQRDDPAEAYLNVTRRVDPPLAKSGGVMLDGCIITVPDGARFYPLVLNGDVQGWLRQIDQGASELGLLTGKIISATFLVSDGRSYPLTACSVEFD